MVKNIFYDLYEADSSNAKLYARVMVGYLLRSLKDDVGAFMAAWRIAEANGWKSNLADRRGLENSAALAKLMEEFEHERPAMGSGGQRVALIQRLEWLGITRMLGIAAQVGITKEEVLHGCDSELAKDRPFWVAHSMSEQLIAQGFFEYDSEKFQKLKAACASQQ